MRKALGSIPSVSNIVFFSARGTLFRTRIEKREKHRPLCEKFKNMGAHGVVVSHPLRMRKALGSNPSVSTPVHAEAL